jgi:hypothetical protein
VGIEDQVRKALDGATTWTPGATVRDPIPSGDDVETRLVKLELAMKAQREALLQVARKLDDLSSKAD